MRRSPKWLVAALVLLTACSTGAGADRSDTGLAGASPGGSPGAAGISTANPHYYSSADDTGPRSPAPKPSLPPELVLQPGPDGTYDIPNFVKAEVPDYESWEGPTCRPPRPGSICKVRFIGSAYSKTGEGDTLWLLAFENGSTTPTVSGGPIPMKKTWNTINYFLTYKIGAGATEVRFKVELRDPKGKVLAANRAQRFFIGR